VRLFSKSGQKLSFSKVQKLHSEKAIIFRPLLSRRLQKVTLNGGTFFRLQSRLFNPIEIISSLQALMQPDFLPVKKSETSQSFARMACRSQHLLCGKPTKCTYGKM
jgi:hypothetical protein